ncbi:hypothetical protein GCM10023094_28780 [Rhodococcus olei]|uniref:Uncharacterized protein n=1 Tax=Rhodococcus olei TaxID=2161675 RepID=A0ABP8P647_9NOCA
MSTAKPSFTAPTTPQRVGTVDRVPPTGDPVGSQRRCHHRDGVRSAARLALRFQYRVARLPFHLLHIAVLEPILDDSAPTRLAYERLLIDCDRTVARLLADGAAADRAERLRRRSAPARYTIARRHRQIQSDTDAVLDRHRARFEERRRHTDESR